MTFPSPWQVPHEVSEDSKSSEEISDSSGSETNYKTNDSFSEPPIPAREITPKRCSEIPIKEVKVNHEEVRKKILEGSLR